MPGLQIRQYDFSYNLIKSQLFAEFELVLYCIINRSGVWIFFLHFSVHPIITSFCTGQSKFRLIIFSKLLSLFIFRSYLLFFSSWYLKPKDFILFVKSNTMASIVIIFETFKSISYEWLRLSALIHWIYKVNFMNYTVPFLVSNYT